MMTQINRIVQLMVVDQMSDQPATIFRSYLRIIDFFDALCVSFLKPPVDSIQLTTGRSTWKIGWFLALQRLSLPAFALNPPTTNWPNRKQTPP